MKKNALILSASLAVILVTSAIAVAEPTLPVEGAIQPIIIEEPGAGTITPYVVDKTFDYTATGKATVQYPFTVNGGYEHLKLFIKNLSSNSVNVTLTHTDTDLVYFAKSIPANGSLEWFNFNEGYPQGMRSGSYILQWSGGGSLVNSQVFGKLGSATTDF